MSRCKWCGQEIEWIRTEAGAMLPADPTPVFVIEGDGCEEFMTDEGELVTGRRAVPSEEHDGLLVAFAPHRRTCQSDGERRGRP